ncbi:autophagy protein 5, putative [Plasmodium gallinaceum]|uniref:Autophagy protein 5 n=1 Tax=Plasmodium gallinaceum TaxID=5849 RepID=A0A1J1GXS3_PLAGA|nr:autophagy protein 5, putative [Plasmodium gallinaceum]CRG95808.1 autophagy protein 5, putative [Plasmodium gallinaceum]
MKPKKNIPFLEKPNIEEINNNIKESGLVLCVSLNEKESVSLVSPSYYYIYVQRYMYLSNIIPKCLEYFKSFILPFYGNKYGVYFECLKNEKENLDNDSNNKNIKNKSETIILDWRLPIGVLFDIYCDIENENAYINGKKQNLKFCSSSELFYDCINILEASSNEKDNFNNIIIKKINDANEYNNELNKDSTKNSINYSSKIECNNEINVDLDNDNINNKPISKGNIQMSLNNLKEIDNLKKKCDENKENNKDIYEKNKYFKNNSKYYKLIMKKDINNEWYEKQFLNISNKNIPWKLIVHFKGEEDYPYNLKKNDKKIYNGNINVLAYNSCIPLYKGFSDFEENIINQLKKASYIFNKSNRLIQMLPQQVEKEILYNLKNFNVENICSLYRKYIDYNMIKFIDYFNNEFVKKINFFFVYMKSIENSTNEENKKREESNIKCKKYDNFTHIKNMEFCDKLEENINYKNKENDNILKTVDCNNENLSIRSNELINQINESKIDYLSDNNMIKNNIRNNSISNVDDNNHSNIDPSTNNSDQHFEKKNRQNKDNLLFQNINEKCKNYLNKNSSPSYSNYTKEKYSIYKILNDDKLVKEVPIIIHIYGPPYNQIMTKFPLFKIIYSEKNKDSIEQLFLYTLGDFLHEQFPSFFRKISKEEKQILGKEKVDIENKEIQDNVEIKKSQYYNENIKLNIDENKNEKYINNKKNVYDTYLNSETIFYFIEDDYLIFSDYMFIIINGIQIPLKTPLYWLTANFSQFDNFLHIILRIPSY